MAKRKDVDTAQFLIKGEELPPITTKTVTGVQLSASGQHLSASGSGIRSLVGAQPDDAPIARTEEMSRPKFKSAPTASE